MFAQLHGVAVQFIHSEADPVRQTDCTCCLIYLKTYSEQRIPGQPRLAHYPEFLTVPF
jgi:hypothetical protein